MPKHLCPRFEGCLQFKHKFFLLSSFLESKLTLLSPVVWLLLVGGGLTSNVPFPYVPILHGNVALFLIMPGSRSNALLMASCNCVGEKALNKALIGSANPLCEEESDPLVINARNHYCNPLEFCHVLLHRPFLPHCSQILEVIIFVFLVESIHHPPDKDIKGGDCSMTFYGHAMQPPFMCYVLQAKCMVSSSIMGLSMKYVCNFCSHALVVILPLPSNKGTYILLNRCCRSLLSSRDPVYV